MVANNMNKKSKIKELKSGLGKLGHKEKVKICIISLVNLTTDGRTHHQIRTLRKAGYDVSIIFYQKEQQYTYLFQK